MDTIAMQSLPCKGRTMWNTPDGIRILTRPEWHIFATGLDMLWDLVENDIKQGIVVKYTEAEAFESLTHEQKLWTLAHVAEALHDTKVPAPPERAYSDATVQAVIEIMQGMLQNEIEDDEFDDLRRNLWQTIDWEEMTSWKNKKMNDMGEDDWDELVHIYEETILLDGDHELASLIIDKAPQQANAIKGIMGIDSEYFTAIPPEPTQAMLKNARATLRRLLQTSNSE